MTPSRPRRARPPPRRHLHRLRPRLRRLRLRVSHQARSRRRLQLDLVLAPLSFLLWIGSPVPRRRRSIRWSGLATKLPIRHQLRHAAIAPRLPSAAIAPRPRRPNLAPTGVQAGRSTTGAVRRPALRLLSGRPRLPRCNDGSLVYGPPLPWVAAEPAGPASLRSLRQTCFARRLRRSPACSWRARRSSQRVAMRSPGKTREWRAHRGPLPLLPLSPLPTTGGRSSTWSLSPACCRYLRSRFGGSSGLRFIPTCAEAAATVGSRVLAGPG